MRKLAVLANAMIIDNIGGKCPALDHYDASMRPRCCFLSREDDRRCCLGGGGNSRLAISGAAKIT